jgi:hypothetical protein
MLVGVLYIALISVQAGGLDRGLTAFLQHHLLARSLARLHYIPPHYVRFLDFAADHVLLQRVGGGYRFVHALLLDYFADQWPALAAESRASVEALPPSTSLAC